MKKFLAVLLVFCLCVCSLLFVGCKDFADHNDGICDFCFDAEAFTHTDKYEICLHCLWNIGTSEID